jgi:hypothetical protein
MAATSPPGHRVSLVLPASTCSRITPAFGSHGYHSPLADDRFAYSTLGCLCAGRCTSRRVPHGRQATPLPPPSTGALPRHWGSSIPGLGLGLPPCLPFPAPTHQEGHGRLTPLSLGSVVRLSTTEWTPTGPPPAPPAFVLSPLPHHPRYFPRPRRCAHHHRGRA